MELYTKRQNHHYRQSDIITVDDRNTSAVKRFLFALLILVLLFFSVNSQALAQYAPEVRTVGVFELRFYSGSINTPNYVPNDSTSSSSNMPWSTDQIDTVVKGMKYWNELINTSRVADTNYKIVINVIRTPLSPGVSANGRGFITDIINNYGKPSETQTDGRIAYNSDGTNPESNINLATTIHELGHVIGFNTNYYSYVDENKNKYFYTNLVDAYGEKWDPTKKDNAGYYNVITANITNGANNGTFDIMGFYDSTTYRTPMFLGKPNGAIEELIGSVHNPDGSLDLSKLDILSQASIMGIDDGGYDVANSLTHSGGLHSVMSYSTFRNMKFLPEIELAMLEELGYSVNRRKAFGHSYYKRSDNLYDGQVIGVGYDSDFIFGIGAHVYMDGLTLLQSADISSRGEEG
ncbi:MAG: hypothetical protein LBB88_01940, partial [Planctomycetaceae bacterium]|nr:hypothetical protein [Planctomycetaceae bacterium]